MNSGDREVRRLRRQIRRLKSRGSGALKWAAAGEEIVLAIGGLVEAHGEVDRRLIAKCLGIAYHQLDYVLSKYRKLARARPRPKRGGVKKAKLAQVTIVDDAPDASRPVELRRPSSVELVLESGIRVSVGSTDQVIDLLESLERRGGSRRMRTA